MSFTLCLFKVGATSTRGSRGGRGGSRGGAAVGIDCVLGPFLNIVV